MEKLIAFFSNARIREMIGEIAAEASKPGDWREVRQKWLEKPATGQLFSCLEIAIEDMTLNFLGLNYVASIAKVFAVTMAGTEKLYGKTSLFQILSKAIEQGMPEAAMVYFSESFREQCYKPEHAALKEVMDGEGLDLTEDSGSLEEGLAVMYSVIAGDFVEREDYPRALAWYKKAIAIYENTVGKEHLDVGAAYNSAAYVCKNLKDYPQALEWLLKAAAVYEKLLEPEHPGTIGVYSDIAWVCDALGDYPQALERLNRVLAVCEKVFGGEHIETAAIYGYIASVYRNMGDNAASLEWYQKALAISEKVLGQDHQYTVTIKDAVTAIKNPI